MTTATALNLFAISDLHVAHSANREQLVRVAGALAKSDDWLILGGDVGESDEDLAFVFGLFRSRFAKLIWVPGNHELWTLPRPQGAAADQVELRGVAKYEHLVAMCRSLDVLTPEDPYAVWQGDGEPLVIAPLFLLYDYTFRPPGITTSAAAVAWAAEEDVVAVDELLLHPDPYASREAWCDARVAATMRRLDAIPPECATILVNHFPLRQTHARLPFVPRFTPWCGTTRTETWHLRYRARVVVYGHLHIPRTFVQDGVAFEEVSFGYPRQRGWHNLPPLRRIWPRPPAEGAPP